MKRKILLLSYYWIKKRTRKMNALQTLQAELATIDAQITTQTIAAKALDKLQKCRLNARTAPKYFDLQQDYMAAVTGK